MSQGVYMFSFPLLLYITAIFFGDGNTDYPGSLANTPSQNSEPEASTSSLGTETGPPLIK